VKPPPTRRSPDRPTTRSRPEDTSNPVAVDLSLDVSPAEYDSPSTEECEVRRRTSRARPLDWSAREVGVLVIYLEAEPCIEIERRRVAGEHYEVER
jgi:hypothetical protein